MLKVAIITFHRAINYGAVLQTYALSRYLKESGYDVQVLDYRAEAIENSYKIKFGLDAYSLKRMLLSPFSEKKKREFYRFIDKNIPHTRSLYTQDDLRKEAQKFDFIVTGSDQVWNSQWTEGDEAYLLNFCKDEQKVSYAASIGKSSIYDYADIQCGNRYSVTVLVVNAGPAADHKPYSLFRYSAGRTIRI